MAKKIVMCRFVHCKHSCREMDKDDAVLIGKGQYYHEDCARIKSQMEKIQDTFVRFVNNNIVYSQLVEVVEKISMDDNYGSDYLLFALRYALKNNTPLKYPRGLYYIIKDSKIREAYSRSKLKEQLANYEITDNNFEKETKFTYKPHRKRKLEDILE